MIVKEFGARESSPPRADTLCTSSLSRSSIIAFDPTSNALGVPDTLTQHAVALARDGKFADAIAEQQQAIAITPNNEQLPYALAQRYAQAGDPQHAIQALAEAIRRQPRLKKQAAEDALFDKLKDRPEFRRLIEP